MHRALDLAQFGDTPHIAVLTVRLGADGTGRAVVTAREMHRCVEATTAAFVLRLGLAFAPEGDGPLALRTTVSLLRPLLRLSEATVHMHASKLGTTSLEARFTLVAPDGGAVARADALLVWVNAAREAVVPLPEAVRRSVLAATPVERPSCDVAPLHAVPPASLDRAPMDLPIRRRPVRPDALAA